MAMSKAVIKMCSGHTQQIIASLKYNKSHEFLMSIRLLVRASTAPLATTTATILHLHELLTTLHAIQIN